MNLLTLYGQICSFLERFLIGFASFTAGVLVQNSKTNEAASQEVLEVLKTKEATRKSVKGLKREKLDNFTIDDVTSNNK